MGHVAASAYSSPSAAPPAPSNPFLPLIRLVVSAGLLLVGVCTIVLMVRVLVILLISDEAERGARWRVGHYLGGVWRALRRAAGCEGGERGGDKPKAYTV
eukprot:gene44324-54200_t